jgi:solute carrier family 25 (adenine nucleotide translocator) protein 4/5/6/31
VSAGLSKTIAAPIESIKLKLEISEIMSKPGSPFPAPYTGFRDCATKFVANEGYRALWNGNVNKSLLFSRVQALNFTFKDYFKRLLGKDKKRDGDGAWVLANFTSGGAAGFISFLLINSKDFVTRKQKGFIISSIGTFLYRALYFGLFDSIQPCLPFSVRDYLMVNFLLGLAVTYTSGQITLPVDVIRNKMMNFGEGWINCAEKIYAEEGLKRFFNGPTVGILKGIAGGGVLAFYLKIHSIISKERVEE